MPVFTNTLYEAPLPDPPPHKEALYAWIDTVHEVMERRVRHRVWQASTTTSWNEAKRILVEARVMQVQRDQLAELASEVQKSPHDHVVALAAKAQEILRYPAADVRRRCAEEEVDENIATIYAAKLEDGVEFDPVAIRTQFYDLPNDERFKRLAVARRFRTGTLPDKQGCSCGARMVPRFPHTFCSLCGAREA